MPGGNPLKYALIERERKFLLYPLEEETRKLPWRIIADRYIMGTNLRLRKIEAGDNIVYKLTKKTRLSAGNEAITTIYLSLNEHELLCKMPSVAVSKTRYISRYGDLNIAIDVYASKEDKLWIAEVEFDSEEDMSNFVMPLPYETEVTGNDEFTGFALANRFGSENRSF